MRKCVGADFFSLIMTLVVISLCAWLLSVIVAKNDTITDARNYYTLYNFFMTEDLPTFAVSLVRETGKFEPALYILVYGFFHWFVSGFQSFSFSCMFLIILGLACFMFAMLKKFNVSHTGVYLSVFFSVIIYTVWYPSYSSVLWVWRSHLAFTLVFIAVFNAPFRYCLVLVALSAFLHYSSLALAVVVWFFLVGVRIFPQVSYGVKFACSLLAGGGASFLIGIVKSVVVAGDGVWVSDTNAGVFVYAYSFAMAAVLATMFLCVSFLKIDLSDVEKKSLAALLCIILFFMGLSITSLNSHQDLMRIMQPAFIIIPVVLVALFIRSTLWVRCALIGLLLPGLIMGVRSCYMYMGGW